MAKILYFITDMNPICIQLALEHKKNEVGICLLQDAVYFVCKGRKGNGMMADVIKLGILVFAARKDVELRGLAKQLYEEIKVLDYDEIIDLILNYERVVNI
jgi:sulfur relay protein TusB/DsrH